jgi:hypothetical protein
MPTASERPAFYALERGGWRDGLTLLHLPYTAWHLSYFALGAAAAPHLHAARLGWGLVAFFLAVGVAAHALDELHGRPLDTAIASRTLIAAACLGLGGALAIGVAGVLTVSATLVPLVVVGGFLVLAYNLELFGGRFHGDAWFAVAWGAFPALTGYVANAEGVSATAVLIAAGCLLLSVAQRRLSRPARELRRGTASVSGVRRRADGSTEPLSVGALLEPLEGALSALSVALVVTASALVVARL